MTDDQKRTLNFMKNFKEESPETTVENAEPVPEITVAAEPVCLQSQEIQAPTNQQSLQPSQPINNNTQFTATATILNAFDGKADCIGKRVLIPNPPNPPIQALIGHDMNYNVFLCTLNSHTMQYTPIGLILFENSEYVFYQNGCKVGTLSYGSLQDTVWHLTFTGMSASQQRQHAQYYAQNNQHFTYEFANVPPEQASSIIHDITKNNPPCNIKLHFAPSSQNQDDYIPTDVIDIPSE